MHSSDWYSIKEFGKPTEKLAVLFIGTRPGLLKREVFIGYWTHIDDKETWVECSRSTYTQPQVIEHVTHYMYAPPIPPHFDRHFLK